MPEHRHPSGLFSVTTAGTIERLLKQWAEQRRALWLSVGRIVRADFRRNFESGGPGWKPLAPSTIAQKTAMRLPRVSRSGRIPGRLMQNGNFGPSNILIRTGAYRDAASIMNVTGNLTEIARDHAEFGVRDSVIPYAKFHQRGTGPYVIRARNARALHFLDGSGASVFRRAVQHPGLAARPLTVSATGRASILRAALDWLLGRKQPEE